MVVDGCEIEEVLLDPPLQWLKTNWNNIHAKVLPEAKRSVLRKDAIDVIQLSSGMHSSELLSGLQW